MKAKSLIVRLSALITMLLIMMATPASAQHLPAERRHEHHATRPHLRVGVEGEFNLHLQSLVNDEAMLAEVRVVFPSLSVWVGAGLGTISGLGVPERPAIFGLVVAASLGIEPRSLPFQLVFRAYLDHQILPDAQLIRLEARIASTWRVGPAARIVADYTPAGWNPARPHEEYWEGIFSAGGNVHITRNFTASALVGVAAAEDKRVVATLHGEWLLP